MGTAELRNPELARRLAARIAGLVGRETALMEVCGTHTMAIGRHGLRTLLPPGLKLLSGPGCPVCVTSAADIDRAQAIAREHRVAVATFGDLFRVPGSRGSLEELKAAGAEVHLVYSPAEAVALARARPGREVLFLGIGFETTTPTVAAAVRLAAREGLGNFSVLSLGKTVPPALRAILGPGECRVDGFLLPGHVCAVTGTGPFAFVAEEFRRPCVVTGFEPLEILQGILMLLRQLAEGRAEVEIQYRRAVRPEGNPHARALAAEVFRPADAQWRAIGVIPGSGLALAPEFQAFAGADRFPVAVEPAPEPPGCLCGRILMGLASPGECPLFGRRCTPAAPVGPCMVSSEGTCAAWYKYGES